MRFKKSAIKGLRKMPRKISGRMVEDLERIAADPSNFPGDWKRLIGSTFWRLRVGRFRAICELRNGEMVLLVINAGPRGDIYK